MFRYEVKCWDRMGNVVFQGFVDAERYTEMLNKLSSILSRYNYVIDEVRKVEIFVW